MASKLRNEFLQATSEFHPNDAGLSGVVDVLTSVYGSLDMRLDGKPTIVPCGLEIGENASLHGILVDVAGNVTAAVLAGFGALDVRQVL